MLMPFDELDSLMKHYLNPNAYSNMCEIIDSIRAKVGEYLLTKKKLLFFSSVKQGGVGETPSDSARNNGRRALSSDKIGSTG